MLFLLRDVRIGRHRYILKYSTSNAIEAVHPGNLQSPPATSEEVGRLAPKYAYCSAFHLHKIPYECMPRSAPV
jgi:hypothetical protein